MKIILIFRWPKITSSSNYSCNENEILYISVYSFNFFFLKCVYATNQLFTSLILHYISQKQNFPFNVDYELYSHLFILRIFFAKENCYRSNTGDYSRHRQASDVGLVDLGFSVTYGIKKIFSHQYVARNSETIQIIVQTCFFQL